MSQRVVLEVTRLLAFAAFALATPWLAAPAAAAEDRPSMQACGADARQWCAGVQPGGGRIAGCLREHEQKLQPACAAQLGQLEACAAEMKRLCPQARGEGELRRCVGSKRSELSAGCRAAAGA
jgi:hypothetical protein